MFSLLFSLTACSAPSSAPVPAAAPPPPPDVVAEHEHDHHDDAMPAAAVPDGYAAIITELRTHQANLTAIFAAGKLKDVHPEAKALMELAVAAPAKADASTAATVALTALDLKQKADEMHDKADAGDAAGAEAAFAGVVADIDALAKVAAAPAVPAMHDHTPQHGGQVSMSGNYHVEYVAGKGEYHVWVTDAHRNAVPDPVSAALRDGSANVALSPDATGGFTAKGNGAGTRPVMVDVTAGDQHFSLGFNAAE